MQLQLTPLSELAPTQDRHTLTGPHLNRNYSDSYYDPCDGNFNAQNFWDNSSSQGGINLFRDLARNMGCVALLINQIKRRRRN